MNAADNSIVINKNIQNNQAAQVPVVYQELNQALQKLANPQSITEEMERQTFASLKEQLIKDSQQGDLLANTLLQAAPASINAPVDSSLMSLLEKLAHPENITNPAERDQYMAINQKLENEEKKDNKLAKALRKTVFALAKPKENGLPMVELPKENEVQTVNLDDYENVKKMWLQMYLHGVVPKTFDEPNRTREEWIKDDLTVMYQTINLLISGNKDQIQQGMSFVYKIIPFLLIGGFSQAEVVAYLKAKQTAAEEAINTLSEQKMKEQEEAYTTVEVANKPAEEKQSMTAAVDEPLPTKTPAADQASDQPI